MININKKDIRKFWSKVEKTDNCWNWHWIVGGGGGGKYGIMKINKKPYYAHRLSYEINIGEIPKGLLVCHHCDNPPCTNPEHLFLGTHEDNARDKVKKKRSLTGERNPIAKLNDEKVFKIRELYSTKIFTQTKLAKIFNVSQHIIWRVVRKKSWVHI